MVKKAIVSKKPDRKTFLKGKLKEHIIAITSKGTRSFDIMKVVFPKRTKGTFKNYLKGDLKMEDAKVFYQILQELKKEKFLVHVGGRKWVRSK